MFRTAQRRTVAVFALTAILGLLTASGAQARPLGSFTWSGDQSIFDLTVNLLTSLWGKSGSSLDPNGTPGDTGSGLDPDGSTTPADGDAGSGLDPNGSTAPANGDAGSGLDPNGGR